MAGCTILSLAAFAQYKGAQPVDSKLKKGFDAITQDLAKQYLGKLASEDFGGRGTGQSGYMKAARYVADNFKASGLKPLGDKGTYFQNVPFTSFKADPYRSTLTCGKTVLMPGKDFGLTGVTGDLEFSGGITAINLPAGQKFEASAVENKIVILNGKGADRAAVQLAFRNGAKLVLTIADKVAVEPTVMSGHNQNGRARASLRGYISRAGFMKIAEGLELDANSILGERSDGPVSWPDGKTASAKIRSLKENVGVPNVIGKLEGSDPKLKEEFIGLGAHLDHLGTQDGVIYYGADDDGSGTTALLCVAKAMAANPVKPKRSIVFMAFCGEEMGLIGSRYCSDNPPMPLEKMSCLLQMDMVGRNEDLKDRNGVAIEKPEDNVNTISLVGSKRISTELHQATLDANKHIGFVFKYNHEDVYTRSDHAMFARKGVPITFLFSGFHPEYHQPTDTIEKINFAKIVSSARLNYIVAMNVSNMPSMLKRDVAQN